jgi:hypothetical protein
VYNTKDDVEQVLRALNKHRDLLVVGPGQAALAH